MFEFERGGRGWKISNILIKPSDLAVLPGFTRPISIKNKQHFLGMSLSLIYVNLAVKSKIGTGQWTMIKLIGKTTIIYIIYFVLISQIRKKNT